MVSKWTHGARTIWDAIKLFCCIVNVFTFLDTVIINISFYGYIWIVKVTLELKSLGYNVPIPSANKDCK